MVLGRSTLAGFAENQADACARSVLRQGLERVCKDVVGADVQTSIMGGNCI